MRNDHTSELKDKQKTIERLEKKVKNLKTELQSEKSISENLQKELQAKETSARCIVDDIGQNSNNISVS